MASKKIAKKKVSKKITKKVGKKITKKVSKKITKKVNKKTAKKVSKKTTKKLSKKTNKKSSKKITKKMTAGARKKKTSKKDNNNFSPMRDFSTSSSSSNFPSSVYREEPFADSVHKNYARSKSGRKMSSSWLVVIITLVCGILALSIWSSLTDNNEDINDLSETIKQETEPVSQEGLETQIEADPETKLEAQGLTREKTTTAPSPNNNGDEVAPSSPSKQGQPSVAVTAPIVYTVQAGDNFYKIAQKTLGDKKRFDEIIKLNNISSNSQLKIGQELKIPKK